MIKVTFTLDEDTVARLRRAATRLARPQSQVVREAIRDYEARSQKLDEDERQRMLEVIDRLATAGRARPVKDVQAELDEIRRARRESGKRRAARAGE